MVARKKASSEAQVTATETGKVVATSAAEAEQKAADTNDPAPVLVTVRGRISTTHLRAGDVVTVEYTDTVQRLLDAGFIEAV